MTQINKLTLNLLVVCFFIVLFTASLQFGAIKLSIHQLMDALLSHKASSGLDDTILFQIRLPRTLTALIAGGLLGLSGLIMQTVTRNPLACPTMLGTSQCCALIITVLMLFFPSMPLFFRMIIAFAGSFVAGMITLIVSQWGKTPSLQRFILIGISINALCQVLSSLLLLCFPEQAQALLYDLNGSLAHSNPGQLIVLAIMAFIGLVVFIGFLPKLALFNFSSEHMQALGQHTKYFSMTFIAISIWFAVSALSTTGPLFFLGLMVPQISRWFAKKNTKSQVISTTVTGGLILLTADTLIRGFSPSVEQSVGFAVACIGAPFLIFIVRRSF